MPLYYFECVCDGILHPDGHGIELAPDEVADQARGVLLELVNDSVFDTGACRISVAVKDADGSTVHIVQACVSEDVGRMPW